MSPREPVRSTPAGISPNLLQQQRTHGLSALQCAILAALRAAGGRMWMTDLSFELRWRGAAQYQAMTTEALQAELTQLTQRGMLRGPLGNSAGYELTSAGWDASQPKP